MHSFIPTFIISYAFVASLVAPMICPAFAAPIPHGYHTGSQKGYPKSSPSSPWSHIYTYGKLADKFLMVNDVYLTDGTPWQNSFQLFNAVSAYHFPTKYQRKSPQALKKHQPPQLQPSDVVHHVHCGDAGVGEDHASLVEKFKKYAVFRKSALASMSRKIGLRSKALENALLFESPNVEEYTKDSTD